ncbi:MAG: outer membrane lipoprotein carrier protein LolA [Xanthomonadales bacterium]|nr:outer membrane lipoprotein carrier protein LolA [Xanthomonadales bacterium]
MTIQLRNGFLPAVLTLGVAGLALASADPDLATEAHGEVSGEVPGEVPGGRAALEQFADGLERFHATFEQVVLNSDGEVQDSNTGEMWLSRPSLFRWEYGGDFPEVIVADGERVWIWDVSLEQITVKDQASLANDSPLSLLTDLSRLDTQFEVRDLGVDDGLAYVELRSVLDGAEFDRVLLGIRGQQLELMAMEDAFGLRTEIRLQSSQRNPELESGLFAFEIPDGVDVVGDIAFNGGPSYDSGDETGDEEAE